MKKRLLAALMALAMSMSLIPATAFADTTSESSGNVTIDKTATNLVKDGDNYKTTVTLSIGATEEKPVSDVVFVLDKSTSPEIENIALGMLEDLLKKVNTDSTINVGVIIFNKTANKVLPLEELSEDKVKEGGKIYNAFKTTISSGTNIESGIRAGIEMLAADTKVKDENKHLVLVTDGVTYQWNAEDDSVETIYYLNNSNGEYSLNSGNEETGKYLQGAESVANLKTWYENYQKYIAYDIETYGTTYVSGQYKAEKQLKDPDEINFYATVDGETVYWDRNSQKYVTKTKDEYSGSSANDGAVYKAVTAWKNAVEDHPGYNYYIYATNKYETSYPWAPAFVKNLSDFGGDAKTVSDQGVEGMFDNVKNTILYEIQSGTVTDVIGDDFDWISMDTVTIKVNGETITSDDDYSVSYNEETSTLTWKINTPVKANEPVTLSYDLKLKNEKVEEVLNNPYTAEFDTNESAELTYKDSNDNEKEELFPVPTVSLSGKISEPDMHKVIIKTDENGNKATDSNASVAANESVDFELRSTIPEELTEDLDYTYTNDKVETSVKENSVYELKIHDVMAAELSLNIQSIKVTINDDAVNSNYYTISSSDLTDGCTFEITMDLLKLYADNIIAYSDLGVTDIVVSYTATLSGTEDENGEFVVKAGAYENTAWVTWDDETSEKDTVEVITYGINVFKYDQSNVASDSDGKIIRENSKGLSGATFRLYYDSECIKPVEDSTKEAITLTSDEDGYITYEGLAAGTYYLKETEAPSGYVSSGTPLPIVIPDDTDAETYIVTLNFANAPIPSTGGAGTRMYLIGGACLIAAAGTVFAVSRRKKED